MTSPTTDSGYGLYDMLSMLQKSIRRNDYNDAGFAANELKNKYRTAMWNRLFVISAEDCFGIITKEIVALRRLDEIEPSNDQFLSNAVSLMCRSKKSRDACYFACNFVLDSRSPRNIKPDDNEVGVLKERITRTQKEGQYSIFDYFSTIKNGAEKEEYVAGKALQIAIQHRDMDMIGSYMNQLRKEHRDVLWKVFEDYAVNYAPMERYVLAEIKALHEADERVNRNKKEKDEIFISKAAMVLCYAGDEKFHRITGADDIDPHFCKDWNKAFRAILISKCELRGGIPEWVFDCHTIRGRKMGKTDFDMTTTEQKALNPLQEAYFDDASWLYTYEQDYREGRIGWQMMEEIRRFAENRESNPVQYLHY